MAEIPNPEDSAPSHGGPVDSFSELGGTQTAPKLQTRQRTRYSVGCSYFVMVSGSHFLEFLEFYFWVP
jgi:hypothetical protein